MRSKQQKKADHDDLLVVSRMLRTFHFQAVAGLASVSICFSRSMFI